MVTVLKDPFLEPKTLNEADCTHDAHIKSDPQKGYEGYVEPDTKIPPEAKSVLSEISVNGVLIAEAAVLAEAQLHPADTPGEALNDAARSLVVRELLLQEAESLGISPDPLVTDDDGTELKEDALIRQLMEQEVKTPVSGLSERKRYYEAHHDRFKSETIYEAHHILLACKENENREVRRELARSLIRELEEQPWKLHELAKEHSACPSKNDGGNLGQLTRGSTVPEFETVLERMEAGKIWSEPVESRFGLHIVYLASKIPGEALPFEYVEDRIGAWLEASSWSRAVSQYIRVLSGKADIKGIDINSSASPLVQ